MRKKKRFEEEIFEARNALHEAAKVIAELAKEEPKLRDRKLKTQDRKLDTGHKTSRPSVPSPVPKPVPVFPTGHHAKDVANLEEAIMKAGKGGVVLLKAKDRSGKKRHFNLTAVTDLSLPFEVSLKTEKDARIKFSD